MDAVFSLGLPIEVVNSAADYFVHRVTGWRDEIEVLLKYSNCVFYRPTPTLFVLLKMNRLTEQDLADCLAVIAKAQAERLRLDKNRLLDAIGRLVVTDDAVVGRRREELRRAIEE